MCAHEFKTQIGGVNPVPLKEGGGDPCLVVVSGPNLGEVFPLSQSPVEIGRNEDADIICDDPLISRKHAQIIKNLEAQWRLIDMHSTNGTYLNFQRVESLPLHSGDKISIGKTIFKFLDRDSIETTFHDELYTLSTMDGLTQIYRRSRFEELLEKAMQGARNGYGQLALCMIDIDHFKKINDTYGHQAGDYVLRRITSVIKQVIRREDIFARYGGEEFCLLLVNKTLQEGVLVAQKVRQTVENHVFEFEGETITVTVSIGVFSFESQLESTEKFLARADEKLYQAKHEGRNCVCYEEELES